MSPIKTALVDTQAIDGTTLSDESYERLWRALEKASLDSRDDFDWDPTGSPYPGLSSFDEADAAVCFGRTQDTRELLETIRRMKREEDSRLLVIAGASGSGKSSLVRAGLVMQVHQSSGPIKFASRKTASCGNLISLDQRPL